MMYLLFSGQIYYACGGYNDFVESFETLEEAINKGEELVDDDAKNWNDWYHIADSRSNSIVYRSQDSPHGGD